MEADGDFLWWLGRFLGTWRTEAGTHRVGRAANGWPNAWDASTGARVPFETVVRTGTHGEVATGLGPRPVTLSALLMAKGKVHAVGAAANTARLRLRSSGQE